MKLNNKVLERIWILFAGKFLRNSAKSHYLDSDFFARCADFEVNDSNFDQLGQISESLSSAKSIFIKSELLDEFVKIFGNQIKATLIVAGKSDKNFKIIPTMPPSVKILLGQNILQDSAKGTYTLPLGIETRNYGRTFLFSRFVRRDHNIILDKILIPPMSKTNPVRTEISSTTLDSRLFLKHPDYLVHWNYFRLISKYKFILCLEGNGWDTHRLWEVLYMGNFPVLLETEWSLNLSSLGLPVLLVPNLFDARIETLRDFYNKNKYFDPKKCDLLLQEFWQDFFAKFANYSN